MADTIELGAVESLAMDYANEISMSSTSVLNWTKAFAPREEETGRAANAALKAAKRSAGLISVNDENQVQAAEGLWVSGPVLFDAHALVILRRVGRFGWTNYWILMTAEAGVWSRADGAPFATAHAQPKAGLVGALFGS